LRVDFLRSDSFPAPGPAFSSARCLKQPSGLWIRALICFRELIAGTVFPSQNLAFSTASVPARSWGSHRRRRFFCPSVRSPSLGLSRGSVVVFPCRWLLLLTPGILFRFDLCCAALLGLVSPLPLTRSALLPDCEPRLPPSARRQGTTCQIPCAILFSSLWFELLQGEVGIVLESLDQKIRGFMVQIALSR
jgi:hypothetical protein